MSDSTRDRASEPASDPVGEPADGAGPPDTAGSRQVTAPAGPVLPADGAGPPDTAGDRVGELAERASRQDGAALAELMPLVYDELRRLARGYLGRERRAYTLQPTALVNEAYLRLLKDRKQDWRTRAQVIGIAAVAMRQILIEAARARAAQKRGGNVDRVTLDEGLIADHNRSVDVLAIDEALHKLAAIDAEQARLVELRFFGGLTIEESAAALGVSPATVKRHWAVARAWLQREITRGDPDGR